MKKKSTVKKGPLGTPLGNPLGYFNSQKAKRSSEPKQRLVKRQDGGVNDPEYLAWKQQKQAAADKKRDTEFTPGQQGKFIGSGIYKMPYDLWQMSAKSPMNKYYKENPNSKYKYYYEDEGFGKTMKAQDPGEGFPGYGGYTEDQEKFIDAYDAQQKFESTFPQKLQNMLPEQGYLDQRKKGGSVKPSAGLSKKTKSNIAKKASAGKDIGKKGKGFAKVAAAAGGGEKGKRIAAAAMWKNIKRG